MNYHLFKYFQAVNEKPHLQSRGSEDADNFQFMRCKNQSVLLRAVIETEDSHSEQSLVTRLDGLHSRADVFGSGLLQFGRISSAEFILHLHGIVGCFGGFLGNESSFMFAFGSHSLAIGLIDRFVEIALRILKTKHG